LTGSCLRWINEQDCTSLGNYYCANGQCVYGYGGCVNWTCGDWGKCIIGTQERLCTCGTDSSLTRIEEFNCYIKPLKIIYSPVILDLTIPGGEAVNFSVIAFEQSNLAEPPTIVIDWFADTIPKSGNAGIGTVTSILSGIYNKVIARVSDNDNLVNIEWNIEYVNSTCKENWTCEWTLCDEEGYSAPINCTDKNNCGTNRDYPKQRICQCTADWLCSDWSECQAIYTINDVLKGKVSSQGKTSQFCNDTVKCYNDTMFEEDCNLTIPITAEKVIWCNDSYVNIKNKFTGSLVSRVKETQISDIKKVDIGFVVSNFTSFCDYCYNGIQDYDETGVDCGGNCPACIEMPKRFDYWLWLIILLWILLLILILIYIYYSREERKSGKEMLINKIKEIGNKKI
jgi:hypothetical protein